MSLFPAKQPLEYFSVDLLGPLPKSKADNRFILVITDGFTKQRKVIQLKRTTTGLDVPKAVASHRLLKYGAPKEVLSGNVP